MGDYRVNVTVPGLRHDADWEGFLDRLHDSAELGPVLSWDAAATAVVTVSMPSEDPAGAVMTATWATTRALRGAGLGHLYPSAIEVSLAD